MRTSKKEVFLHFKNQFSKKKIGSFIDIRGCLSRKLSSDDNIWLQRAISEDELDFSLNQCCYDKAPGPDGINAGVLKVLWPSIKGCVLNTFQDFINSGLLPKGMKSPFNTLIPKVPSPSIIKDFRPISLINCSLKILSKVFTNRISNMMDKLISPNQTRFMKGRQISEGILITNEIIHSIKSNQTEGIILKLDL